jgi:hypothetical protein
MERGKKTDEKVRTKGIKKKKADPWPA